MRILLAFILLLFISLKAQAHDFYFAFAEVEYNQDTQRFEGTIIFTTHDLERAIQKEHPEFPTMDTLTVNSSSFQLIRNEIENGFSISVDGQKLEITLIGMENFLTGTSNIYFESEITHPRDEISFEYDLLMDEYEGQQNKISLLFNEDKETLYFINNERKQNIKLNKTE